MTKSIIRTCALLFGPQTESRPKSLDEVDKQLLETYDKLGIPLKEQEALAGVVAVRRGV